MLAVHLVGATHPGFIKCRVSRQQRGRENAALLLLHFADARISYGVPTWVKVKKDS